MVHDFTIAFTVWGFLDPNPPADLLALRAEAFVGVAHIAHAYDQQRALVDSVPEATLRMTPQAVTAAYPVRWRELLGV